MIMKIGKKQIPALVVTLIAVVGVVSAAIIVPMQKGPAIGNGSASQNCNTLTSSQTQALPGTYSYTLAILFDCSTFGFAGTTYSASACVSNHASCPQTPAFTIGATGLYTPQISPPGSFDKIFFYPASTTFPFPGPFGGGSCSLSGSQVQIYGVGTLPPPYSVALGEYNYCAEFHLVPGLGLNPFSVTWTTP